MQRRSAYLSWMAGVPALLAAVFAAASPSIANDDNLMDALVAAYPKFLLRHEGNVVIWRDGTRMQFSDGIAGKKFEQRLDKPSLKDMFSEVYPMGSPTQKPAIDVDPGRMRNEPFFRKMYGDCRNGQSLRDLVDVIWLPRKMGKKLRVTRINGVADQLKEISIELDKLPSSFDKYLIPPAGGFACRTIAGTSRLSAHGMGIAIDISTAHSNYWRWNKGGALNYRNEIPSVIVRIFEEHGFIWGGKWYHFDTMHFEYRPELLRAAMQPKRLKQ